MLHSAVLPTPPPFCFSSPPRFIPTNIFRRFGGWKQGSVRFKSELGTFGADGWSNIHSVDNAGLFERIIRSKIRLNAAPYRLNGENECERNIVILAFFLLQRNGEV